MMSDKLYRFVNVSERLPEKFGMYICHVKVIDEGLTFRPVSYCQFDTIRKEWTNPSVCGTKGEVTEWLELIER